MSLINTQLDKFRAASNLDKNEVRLAEYGALRVFEKQNSDLGGIYNPDIADKFARSANVGTTQDVIDNANGNVTKATFTVTITGAENTSQVIDIVAIDYKFGFLTHPAAHESNRISLQRDFNAKMEKNIRDCLALMNTDALTALENAKSQVFNEDLGWTPVANEVTVPLAQRDDALGGLDVIMRSNDYPTPIIDVVGNGRLEHIIRTRLLEQGEMNQRNKSYQWLNKNLFFDRSLADTAGNAGTGFAIAPGNLAVLTQFAHDSRLRHQSRSGHVWDVVNVPGIGQMSYYGYETAVDGSAVHGASTAKNTATLMQAHSFHVAKAYLVAYNSDAATQASPLFKFGILAS
jgi:hypothetical protein